MRFVSLNRLGRSRFGIGVVQEDRIGVVEYRTASTLCMIMAITDASVLVYSRLGGGPMYDSETWFRAVPWAFSPCACPVMEGSNVVT